VLVLSLNESPSMPLRFWIAGYAPQGIVHMVCGEIDGRPDGGGKRAAERRLEDGVREETR
jgi:hypothetical protein